MCRPIPQNYSRLSASWALRPLTNAPLIKSLFRLIEDVEETQAQRCVALHAQPDLIRSTTLFHWWPQRLHKRHASKTCANR